MDTGEADALDRSIATLEREVAEAERRLDSVKRSVRAAIVESTASANASQFDELAPRWSRPPPPFRPGKAAAFLYGALLGAIACGIIGLLLRNAGIGR